MDVFKLFNNWLPFLSREPVDPFDEEEEERVGEDAFIMVGDNLGDMKAWAVAGILEVVIDPSMVSIERTPAPPPYP